MSTSGGFSPATNDNYNQSQDAGNIRQREEVKGAVEVGDDTETVSFNKNEGTGIRDEVSAESTRVEPAQPEPSVCYVEIQDNEVNDSVPHNENYNGEKETDEGTIMRRDEKKITRNAEAEGQTEKREFRVSNVIGKWDRQTDSGEQSEKALTEYLNEGLQVSEGLPTDTKSVLCSLKNEFTVSKEQSVQHSGKRASTDTQSSIKVKKTRTEPEKETSDGSKNTSDQKEKSNDNKSQKEISDISQNLNFVSAEVKDDSKRNDENVGSRRRSGRHSGGDVEGQKNQSQERQHEFRHKDLSNQVKEDEKKRENVHFEKSEDIFAGQERSEGGRKCIEKNGEGSKQLDKHSVLCSVKVEISKDQLIQHSVKRNKCDIESSMKVMTRTEPELETSDGSKNRRDQKEVQFDPGVNNLDLEVAPATATKKKQTKGDRGLAEKKEIIVFHSSDKTTPNVSHAQIEATGIKHPGKDRDEKRRKWWHVRNLLKQDRRGGKKQNKKTESCCRFSKKLKNKYQLKRPDTHRDMVEEHEFSLIYSNANKIQDVSDAQVENARRKFPSQQRHMKIRHFFTTLCCCCQEKPPTKTRKLK